MWKDTLTAVERDSDSCGIDTMTAAELEAVTSYGIDMQSINTNSCSIYNQFDIQSLL